MGALPPEGRGNDIRAPSCISGVLARKYRGAISNQRAVAPSPRYVRYFFSFKPEQTCQMTHPSLQMCNHLLIRQLLHSFRLDQWHNMTRHMCILSNGADLRRSHTAIFQKLSCWPIWPTSQSATRHLACGRTSQCCARPS